MLNRKRHFALLDVVMAQFGVIAYHLVWTAYGTWLPNDPRGSGSSVIHTDILRELGELHFGRKRVQPCGWEIKRFYKKATPRLVHAPLSFEVAEREEITQAFEAVIREERFTCYACAIMRDHVHILIRKHKRKAEEMMQALKDASADRLKDADLRPYENIPCGPAAKAGKCFSIIPMKCGKRSSILTTTRHAGGSRHSAGLLPTPYDGWPFHRKRNQHGRE